MVYPSEQAAKWQLSDEDTYQLVTDFTNGMYFYLTTRHNIDSLDDYFDAMDIEVSKVDATITLLAMAKIGQDTPEYVQFKATCPEFFI